MLGYDIQSIAFVPDPVQPPNVVPLPAGVLLYLSALALGIGVVKRPRKQTAA